MAEPLYDANTRELSSRYRRGVERALPRGVEPSEAFWRELTLTVEAFLASQQNRETLPNKIKRRHRIDGLVTKLGNELRGLAREMPRDSVDPLLPNRALAELSKLKQWTEAQIAACRTINEAFRGKTNPHRQFLYSAILDLWYRGLGQHMRTSSQAGQATGPLVRFFSACVNPLLPKPLTANGIAQIVDREKARRRHGFFDTKT